MEIKLDSQTYIVDYTHEEGMKSTDPYMMPDDPDEITINEVHWVSVDEYGNETIHDITDMYHERFDGELEDKLWEKINNN
tara:strand:- start:633 stop:872 length:240 start_codon:yes stop_codon:yes gene_type:complete